MATMAAQTGAYCLGKWYAFATNPASERTGAFEKTVDDIWHQSGQYPCPLRKRIKGTLCLNSTHATTRVVTTFTNPAPKKDVLVLRDVSLCAYLNSTILRDGAAATGNLGALFWRTGVKNPGLFLMCSRTS